MADKKTMKSEKHAGKNKPMELSETDLNPVQGAQEFFDATLTEIKWPTSDAKGNPADKPGSNTLSPPNRKR